jgi:hypothetical protein
LAAPFYLPGMSRRATLYEFTREAFMLGVDRKLNSTDVLDALTDLYILRGPPG